ncbi:hypothetical protein HDF16_005485 [Granulicella aggregans]|uniref:FtsX-like permease family protein n=1 Tax=Granulicella aggregans TaxID=474949 RepID=A0A7W7ZJK4_9BACT|nr:ABC transporter permease [Granulicella aggregans]MBB5060749.1 hypothetical protein [Granulicella aggregans]
MPQFLSRYSSIAKKWDIGRPLLLATSALFLSFVALTTVFSVYSTVRDHAFPYPRWQKILQLQFLRNGIPSGVVWVRQDDLATIKGLGCVDNAAISMSSQDLLSTSQGTFKVIHISSSNELASLLSVSPLMGLETPRDGALLAYDAWERLFDKDATILGTRVKVGARVVTITGIMPRTFRWSNGDIFTDLQSDDAHAAHPLYLAIKQSASASACAGQAMRIVNDLVSRDEGQGLDPSLHLAPLFLGQPALGEFTRHLYAIMIGTLILAIVSGANAAVLSLTRAVRDRPTRAVEIALGSSLPRLIWTSSKDYLACSFTAALAALVTSYELLKHPTLWLPLQALPAGLEFHLSGLALLSLTSATLLATLIMAILPNRALILSPTAVTTALAGSKSTASKHLRYVYFLSVVGQAFLSISLLATTITIVRRTQGQLHVEEGFSTQGVISEAFILPATQYPTWTSKRTALETLRETVGRSADVTISAAAPPLPALDAEVSEGIAPPPAGRFDRAQLISVDDNFLNVFRLTLEAGRPFAAHDMTGSVHVALVSKAFARLVFGSRDPLGRSIYLPALKYGYPKVGRPSEPIPVVTVIGVVADVVSPLIAASARPAVYVPLPLFMPEAMWVHLKASSDARPITEANLPWLGRSTLPGAVGASPVLLQGFYESLLMGSEILLERLFVIFALFSLVIATIGGYSLTEYTAATRTREFGIKLALGAHRRQILMSTLSSSMGGVLLSGFIVWAATFAVSRSGELAAVLGVASGAVVASSTLMVFATIVFASAAPARRATRLDIVTALREE